MDVYCLGVAGLSGRAPKEVIMTSKLEGKVALVSPHTTIKSLPTLSQPCLPESCPDFSATFTTIAFDDSSLRWLEIDT